MKSSEGYSWGSLRRDLVSMGGRRVPGAEGATDKGGGKGRMEGLSLERGA